jgi:hypothetical protein
MAGRDFVRLVGAVSGYGEAHKEPALKVCPVRIHLAHDVDCVEVGVTLPEIGADHMCEQDRVLWVFVRDVAGI